MAEGQTSEDQQDGAAELAAASAAQPVDVVAAESRGRGLDRRAVVVLVAGLLLGGVVSRVINVQLDQRKAQREHERHLARVERDRQRYDTDDVAAQIAAQRAKRGLPRVDAAAPAESQTNRAQAN